MIKRILAVIVVVVVVALSILAYSFLKAPEEASAPIEAIPIVINGNTQLESGNEAAPELVVVATETVQVTDSDVDGQVEPPSDSSVDTEIEEVAQIDETNGQNDGQVQDIANTEDAGQETSPNGDPTIFEIVQTDTEVRFLIDEVLRGAPFTVVGVTDQVAGQFAVNSADLSSAQMGPLLVNARTLATDNEFRDRAIKNRILSTDPYEFITFTPAEIVGLTDRGTVGEHYEFQIVGDLTIRDVTRVVTFDVTAQTLSETQVEGSASATILYDDFGLVIPASQSVSAVADEVILEIDFLAVANDHLIQG